MRRVDIKTEDELFSGPNTGDSLKGIIQYATAFTGGGLTTTFPSYADVFRALALQVSEAHGTATGIYVSEQIIAEMDVEKDQDGHYLLPPFRSADGATVAGARLIPTNALPITVSGTAYDFVGGDLSVVNVLFSDNMSVQIGLDGNDFTKNLKTILVEQELVQFVSANDTQVLVKGNMAASIGTITAS
jgi:HK97 family phage major capsid protein